MADTLLDDKPGFDPAIGTPRAGTGWGWIVGYGVLSAAFGVFAFVFPVVATVAATLVIGAFFIAAGLSSLFAGIFGKAHEGRGYQIGFAIISIIIGLIMALEPRTGALSLTLLVVIWLGMRGAMELIWGYRMKRSRGMMIGLGIVNILLALFVLATLPLSAMTLPGYILGISFLLGGVASIASGLNHKKGADAFALPA